MELISKLDRILEASEYHNFVKKEMKKLQKGQKPDFKQIAKDWKKEKANKKSDLNDSWSNSFRSEVIGKLFKIAKSTFKRDYRVAINRNLVEIYSSDTDNLIKVDSNLDIYGSDMLGSKPELIYSHERGKKNLRVIDNDDLQKVVDKFIKIASEVYQKLVDNYEQKAARISKIDKKQIKYFIEKFDKKLGDSVKKKERDSWVKGINELNKETQDELIKELDEKYE